MILPWRVDVPQDRLPFANWLIIAILIAVFAWQVPQIRERNEAIRNIVSGKSSLTQQDVSEIENIKVPFDGYMLDGWFGKGMLTYMWLHASPLHLVGNLLFLWIFGNAVCSKIGNILYIPVYIFLGMSAAVMYLIFSNTTMLGASGAINGVVGMYLVFFPTNAITCWCLKKFDSPSYVIILLWFVFDIIGVAFGGAGIAYLAHIGGFAAGFAIAVILLRKKFITMTTYEKSLLDIFSSSHSYHRPKVSLWNRSAVFDSKQPKNHEQ